MKPLKSFEEYLDQETINEQSPDNLRADSLVKDAEKSYASIKGINKK